MSTTITPSENEKFLQARVEALTKEVERLNNEIKFVRFTVNEKVTLTDPNFDRPYSEILKIEVHE